MEIIKGIGVSNGVAICPAVILETEEFNIPHRTVAPASVRSEIQSLRNAFLDATQELSDLQVSQAGLLDSGVKDIFAVHLHFLRDRALRKRMTDLITEKHYSAEYAVSLVMRDIAKHFAQAPDRYISERAGDIFDIERRLVRHLSGERRNDLQHVTEPVVVVAHDLTPTQTAQFDKKLIKGFATDEGGRTSHTAIVARSLGIPAVVALGNVTSTINPGDRVIVDGNRGVVIINPDAATLDDYKHFVESIRVHQTELDEVALLTSVTLDGHPIELLGNIEFPSESSMVLDRGGTGIGLYRTEFLYLEAQEEPTEEEHYRAYADVIQAFGKNPVTIRTIDLGADKFTQQRSGLPERNPFLGLRSIRYCLQNLPIFKTQIRAILRASVNGNVKIMFPLITNLLEVRQAKWVVADVKEDLEEQGIEFNDQIPIGIMIETPAAALTVDHLADEVDFFSIGTNDLIQYTLAVDRVNEKVASLYSPLHPAVLGLMDKIAKAAHRARIGVSICGEMASELDFIPLLLGLGFSTLSVAPPMIPEVKKIIRMVEMEQCQRIARRALTFDTDTQTLSFLREEMRKILSGESTPSDSC